MPSIHEEVTIDAPPERVWKVVHEDLKNAPRWTTYLKRAYTVDGGPVGPGTRVRYDLELPAWKGHLELEHTTWNPNRKCAGEFTGGPLKGTWAYSYRTLQAGTKLVYDMEFELTGMLRFLSGMLTREYASGIRTNMAQLKEYVEAGGGPRS